MEDKIKDKIKYWDDNIVESHAGHEAKLVIEYFTTKNVKEISYIDIGANTGKYYDILKKSFTIKDVIMVEPEPNLNRYLVEKFPDMKVFNFAISDVNGESFFDIHATEYFFEKNEFDGINLGLSKLSNSNGKIKVKTVSGYDFLKNQIGELINDLDFIKVDTENRDYNILNSIKDVIKGLDKKPLIVIEHNYHNDMSKEDAKKIYDSFLYECGYDGLDFEEVSGNAFLKPKN